MNKNAALGGLLSPLLAHAAVIATIALAAGLTFWPTIHNGFIDWKDTENLLRFAKDTGFSAIKTLFAAIPGEPYQPLTLATFLVIDNIAGDLNPLISHAANIIIHISNAVLLYLLATQCFRPADHPEKYSLARVFTASGFAALLFAIHPLRVEPVSWVSQRGILLGSLFLLIAALAYIKMHEDDQSANNRQGWHWLMTGGCLLSLLSYPSGLFIPAAFVLLDFYPLRRIAGDIAGPANVTLKGALREKTLLFLMAAAIMLWPFYAHLKKSLTLTYGLSSLAEKTILAPLFYIWRTIVPTHLSPVYEFSLNPGWERWTFILGGVLILAVSMKLLTARKHTPGLLAMWGGYLLPLQPGIGLVAWNAQSISDSYAYLPAMSLALGCGSLAYHIWPNGKRAMLLLFYPAICAILIGSAYLSLRQETIWDDSKTLWEHVLKLNSRNYSAHSKLAAILVKEEKYEEAIQHFSYGVRLRPDSPEAYNNLGYILAKTGKPAEAMFYLQAALKLKPDFRSARNNIGVALFNQGKVKEAGEHFRAVLRNDPDDLESLSSLGAVLGLQGKVDEAMDCFRQVLAIEPDNIEANYNLGYALAKQGSPEAISYLNTALKFDPNHVKAHSAMGVIMAKQGRLDEAMEYLQTALKLNPGYGEAQRNLQLVYKLKAQGPNK